MANELSQNEEKKFKLKVIICRIENIYQYFILTYKTNK